MCDMIGWICHPRLGVRSATTTTYVAKLLQRLVKLQDVHIGHEGKVGAESGVVVLVVQLVVLWSRRLAVLVVAPARNSAVALQRQRVIVTRGDGDEVTMYAVRRRLTVLVVSPARDVAVALQKCVEFRFHFLLASSRACALSRACSRGVGSVRPECE